jgi:hypothetical protein
VARIAKHILDDIPHAPADLVIDRLFAVFQDHISGFTHQRIRISHPDLFDDHLLDLVE